MASCDPLRSTGHDPLASTAPLIVYIDVKSPFAYVARDPTYALGEQLGIEIDWRPLTLDIPSYLGSARLDSQGNVAESERSEEQWTAVKYGYRDARRYAALNDHILRGTVKIWDSSIAAIGMMFAKRQGAEIERAYLDRVFEPFWRRELDIEDVAVIEGVLAAAGAEVSLFETYLQGEGRRLHDRMQQAIFDAGIFGVPSYVVGGEMFFGRENLPLVRWLLSGQSGVTPDVAYGHSGTVPSSEPALALPSNPPPLGVCIDFKNPYCYLAFEPTLKLAAELNLDVEWKPYLCEPLSSPSTASESDDRGTRHRCFRAEYVARSLQRYAGLRGLVIEDFYRHPDASVASMGLLWVNRQSAEIQRAFVEATFERYWGRRLDLADADGVREVMVEAGAVVDGWSEYLADEGPGELAALRVELGSAGVFLVPTYQVEEHVFIGREHLPMIHWLLTDKQGRKPI